ncbi:hypothetical protein EGW08_009010 [Elysia chlorotica]|uniref:RBR-type E3 ubiquitin transferase n=1 Tax=Elysia chlorotica TaxID=188477 RepID=A0A3S1HNZ0_ELYCH|nr:hypothetical protein EGW08_009010 [Elysia chlorotica]
MNLSHSSDRVYLPSEVVDYIIPLEAEVWISDNSHESSQSEVEEVNEEFLDLYEELDAQWAHLMDNVDLESSFPETSPEEGLRYAEAQVCEICLGASQVQRSCCKLYFCKECMVTYINTKVSEGQYRIQCPGSSCSAWLHRNYIERNLRPDMRRRFLVLLMSSNTDPNSKMCPCCGVMKSVEPKQLKKSKRKLRFGLQVCCDQCRFVWCFLCQAPYHTGLSCKEYRKGDGMVRKWAKEWSYGQFNAQKCPKCKIYIQKADGCDHMRCSHCKTDFCYRCGGRYIRTKYLGNHLSHFSIFGCKYRFMPNRPILRRLIRGASFAACLGGGVILAALGVALGACLVGASVVIVPGYGIIRLRKNMKLKQQRKRREAHKAALVELLSEKSLCHNMVAREAALRPLWLLGSEERLAGPALSPEAGTVEGADTHKVHVIVHRSRSMNQDEMAPRVVCRGAAGFEEEREERGFFVNKYTAEGSEMLVVKAPGDGACGDTNDSVVTVTDFKEIPSTGGYMTLVANIVSRPSGNSKKSHAAPGLPGLELVDQRSHHFSENAVGVVLESSGSHTCNESGRDLEKFEGAFKNGSHDRKGREQTKDVSLAVEKIEGRQRRRSASFPRNARELMQACARTDCLGYRRRDTPPQPGMSEQEESASSEKSRDIDCPATCLSDEDSAETGRSYNGCFGNILSKLGQGQQSSGSLQVVKNSGAVAKHQHASSGTSSQRKSGFGNKSSTWEKTHRGCVQTLLLEKALRNANSGDVDHLDACCVGLHGIESLRVSDKLQYMDGERATLSRILSDISQLDIEESVLLRMSKLDADQVQRLLLEDFMGGGSKQISKKLQQHTRDDTGGREESKSQHSVSPQELKKQIGGMNYCCKPNAQYGLCGRQNTTQAGSGLTDGGLLRKRRRRSMGEIARGSFYEGDQTDNMSVYGSWVDSGKVKFKNELPQNHGSSHIGPDRNISPSVVITRL